MGAESRRVKIAAEGDKAIPIWYSPKPGSAGETVETVNRPQPGKTLQFTMRRVAATGRCRKWGTVLYLLAREFECVSGIELGACAGISAMYLSSSSKLKRLVTVEGSQPLAEIARVSLKGRPHVEVVNALFDDAIDHEISSSSGAFSLAYIDGHHEKIATIHYFNRLLPKLKKGALVIFDDISWSYDMRDAWSLLSDRLEFSHTVDLGAIGVCVLRTENDDLPTRKWDLRPITVIFDIHDPLGWKE